jgi:hypothetical protein
MSDTTYLMAAVIRAELLRQGCWNPHENPVIKDEPEFLALFRDRDVIDGRVDIRALADVVLKTLRPSKRKAA